ncbi:hypothetical protein D3C71_77460 [compost metagenome]
MDNSTNSPLRKIDSLPPIKFIRSHEMEQVDVSFLQIRLTSKGFGDGKDLAYFAIQHAARRTLPYGMWTLFDGRQILFNREYQPILEKKDELRAYCDHNTWVDHSLIETQMYFYNDVTSPMRYMVKHLGRDHIDARDSKECKKALLVCLQFLKDFTPKESDSTTTVYSAARL